MNRKQRREGPREAVATPWEIIHKPATVSIEDLQRAYRADELEIADHGEDALIVSAPARMLIDPRIIGEMAQMSDDFRLMDDTMVFLAANRVAVYQATKEVIEGQLWLAELREDESLPWVGCELGNRVDIGSDGLITVMPPCGVCQELTRHQAEVA
jgi:hypothetical protein